MIYCPKQCGSSLTIDWKTWCSCLVLYFILSPMYVRKLPFIQDLYWTGVQLIQLTYIPLSRGSPLPTRISHKPHHCGGSGIIGAVTRLSSVLSFFPAYYSRLLMFFLFKNCFPLCCSFGYYDLLLEHGIMQQIHSDLVGRKKVTHSSAASSIEL